MILIKPDYYDTFKCKADKCTDNCCIGWEIDIDEKTNELYKNINGEFGRYLNSHIDRNGETPFFILDKDERCSLLDENNLCRIISTLGENHLCDICRLHPRFVWDFENIKEIGLGLCCERTCEILLEKKESTTFVEENDNTPSDDNTEPLLSPLLKIQTAVFELIRNKYISLEQRLNSLAFFSSLTQKYFDNSRFKEAALCFKPNNNAKSFNVFPFLELLPKLEIMDNKWKEILAELKNKFNEIISAEKSFDSTFKENEIIYENITSYFIFRYFLGAVYDEDIFSTLMFAYFSVKIIKMCDILKWLENKNVFSNSDRISNMKLYSKEVEYSTENMDIVRDFLWEKFFI